MDAEEELIVLFRVNGFMAGAGSVFRPMLALIGAFFVLVAPGSAFAQTATYNVAGTFNAPATGTLSGSYVVNTATNTIVSANIQVTAGKASDGTTDLPANTFIFSGSEQFFRFQFARAIPANGERGGLIAFQGTKSAPTGVQAFYDAQCIDADCANINAANSLSRFGTVGTVTNAPPPVVATPVPTMTEWAMILFGAILAGGAALYIQRRQSIA